jgi:hypothetical protein
MTAVGDILAETPDERINVLKRDIESAERKC